jgi:hypothetical protein
MPVTISWGIDSPEMKMIGVSRPLSCNFFCNSTPDMLGMRISKRMTAGETGIDFDKNDSGESYDSIE